MELAIKITLFCSLVLLVAVDTSKGDAVCDVTVTQQESQLCCLIHEVITDLDQLLLVCNSDNDVELNASEISESGSGINVTCGNSTSFMNDTMMEQLLSFMNCTESDPIDSNCSAVNFTCTTISTESGTSSIMPTSTSVATLNPTVSPTNGGSTVMSTRKAIGTATVTTPQPTMVQTESTTSGSETIEFQTTAMSDDLTIQTTTTSNQTANMSRVGSSDPIPLSLINILWIVLGCLIALIVITLCAVILACIANCRIRRHKRKKQPTALDIISKWEDTPNESSDIQLLSMKTIEENEGKDNGEQKDDGVEDKEAGKEGSDGKSETKEANKGDDVTVGTFGFAEKVAESIGSKAENPTDTVTKTEAEGQDKKDEVTKEEKNEKLVEVTIEKAVELESTAGTGSGENPTPDNKSAKGTDTIVTTPTEKEKDGAKPEPVPVQIPLFGKQAADEKAPSMENTTEVKTSDSENTDKPKPASPSKDQGVKSETSPSSHEAVAAESVSKEAEPAATITKPPTGDVETVSLPSEKLGPSAAIGGGLSIFTNEDIEKALGIAATKDLDKAESTQL